MRRMVEETVTLELMVAPRHFNCKLMRNFWHYLESVSRKDAGKPHYGVGNEADVAMPVLKQLYCRYF